MKPRKFYIIEVVSSLDATMLSWKEEGSCLVHKASFKAIEDVTGLKQGQQKRKWFCPCPHCDIKDDMSAILQVIPLFLFLFLDSFFPSFFFEVFL